MSRSFRFRQYPVERNHFSAAQAVLGAAARTWSSEARHDQRSRWVRSLLKTAEGLHKLCEKLIVADATCDVLRNPVSQEQ
jgi:hypothetical protein